MQLLGEKVNIQGRCCRDKLYGPHNVSAILAAYLSLLMLLLLTVVYYSDNHCKGINAQL